MTETTQIDIPAQTPSQEPVRLSATALKRLRELIAEEGDTGLMLRLTVDGGGCSGFQYSFALDAETTADDLMFEQEDVRIVTDTASLELLAGCIVDWVENPGAAYFSVDNPNATSSCGCGMSFAI